MNWLGLVGSLVGSVIWPVVVICALILFRRPLTDLIGRLKSYEGLGQRLTFGDRLAAAEASTDEAVSQSAITSPSQLRQGAADTDIEIDSLVLSSESNPSYSILQAWEQLSIAITKYADAVFPGGFIRGSAINQLPRMLNSGFTTESFVRAVQDLKNLRDKVAHGEHKPTPGEAITYVDTAIVLARVAFVEADARQSKSKSREQVPASD